MTSLQQTVHETVSQSWQENREFTGFLLLMGVWILWQPIRTFVNHWRMHRRQLKYPQLVVCKLDTNTTKSRRPLHWSIWNLFKRLLNAVVTAVVFILAILPFRLIQLASPVASAPIRKTASTKKRKLSTRRSSSTSSSSTSSSAPATSSQPASVLRQASSSASVSSNNNSRVGFVEHSNGSIKTERLYYNPAEEPNQSVKKRTKPATQQTRYQSPNHSQVPVREPAPWDVLETPQTQKHAPASRYQPVSQREATPHFRRDRPAAHNSSPYPHRQPSPSTPVNTMVSFQPIPGNGPDIYSPPVSQAPLSEQMRKRRLEGDEPVFGQTPTKRSSLCVTGRVKLGTTRPRITSTRRAVMINKREREEREDRILKDMNTKRVKQVEKANELPALANTDGSDKTSTPSFSFGGAPTAPPTATDGPTNTAPVPVTASNFQFGGGSPATPGSTATPATSGAPTFGNTASTVSTTLPPLSNAGGDAVKPTFQLGSTPSASKPEEASPPTASLPPSTSVAAPFLNLGSSMNAPAAIATTAQSSFGGLSNTALPPVAPAYVAPSFGGGFGATPTPAPPLSTPAPAPAFALGAPAPAAPAFGGGGFGAPAPVAVDALSAFGGGPPAQPAAAPTGGGGFTMGAVPSSGAAARRRAKKTVGRRR